jgi:hypothetical protein
MTNQPLSPAAQAVLRAYEKSNNCYREEWGQLAAALRAAADQVVPVELHPKFYEDCCQYSDVQTRAGIRHQLLTIAGELEHD